MTKKRIETKKYRALKPFSIGYLMFYKNATLDLTDKQAETWLSNGTIELYVPNKTQAQAAAGETTEPAKTATKTTTKTAKTKDVNQ